ncbi:MAG: hypothetical protein V3W34_00610 [Phycisphaerae bacterium]
MRVSKTIFHSELTAAVLLVWLVTAPQPADAESLSQRLPGSAIFYIESTGADALSNAHAQTPLGKMLADDGVAKLVDRLVSAGGILIRKAAADQGEAEVAEAAMRLLATLWHRPCALQLLSVQMADAGPAVEAVLVVDVGADGAERFVKALERVVAKYAPFGPPVPDQVESHAFQRYDLPVAGVTRYGMVDGIFMITLGEKTTGRVLATMKGRGKSMAQDASLVAALKKIGTKGRSTLAVSHVNVQEVLKQARQVWSAMSGGTEPGKPAFPPPVEAVIAAAGIDRLRSMTDVLEIEDGGYRYSAFIALPPVDGRPRWMNQAPVTKAQLSMVPKDVTFAKVANFRLADLYDGLMHLAAAAGPGAEALVANVRAMIEGMMGLRIKEDIVDLFDDGWVVYDSPSSGGLLFTGFTVMVEVRDPEGVLQLLGRLVRFIDSQTGPGIVAVEKSDYKGTAIHFASITGPPIPVAPAWCVHDRYVVIGLYPQVVMRALDHLRGGDNVLTLLDNPDFARGRKMLPKRCSVIAYFDTKAGMEFAYKWLLPVATSATGWARGEGVQIDASMIPSRDAFVGGIYGDVVGMSSDADGLLFTTHGPLPLNLGGTAPAVAALGVSIALPSLARAREEAKRAASVSNVKAIMAACHTYANHHSNQFPGDLQTLVNAGLITDKTLCSPRDEKGRVSYVYVKGHSPDSPPGTVVVYEKPGIGDGGGSAVGFADGRAEWLDASELRRSLKQQEASEPDQR